MSKIYQTIIILSISSLIFAQVCFALPNFDWQNLGGFAQQIEPPEIKVPTTLEEAVTSAQKIGKVSLKLILGSLEKIWREGILPVWQRLFECFKTSVWPRLKSLFKREAETRKPIIEEEFQKKKEELKEEAPGLGKSLWEKFKELIK